MKKDKVIEDNVKLLRKRSRIGIKKYGTTLEDNHTDDLLQHALEEALDLANYLQAEILRKKRGRLKKQ